MKEENKVYQTFAGLLMVSLGKVIVKGLGPNGQLLTMQLVIMMKLTNSLSWVIKHLRKFIMMDKGFIRDFIGRWLNILKDPIMSKEQEKPKPKPDDEDDTEQVAEKGYD